MKENRLFIVALVAVCGALAPIALQVVVPALPYIRADLQTTIGQTQWVVTAFALSLAVAMLIFGPLSDRFGRRRLLIAGVAVFTAGSLLAWQAQTLEVLIVARAIQAMGAGAGASISRAIAADLFSGTDLARVFAYMTMVIVIGPMIAPLAAGYVADTIGWPNIWLGLALIGVLTTVLAIWGVPETAAVQSTAAGTSGWGAVWGGGSLPLYVAVLVTTQIGVYAFISASPYIVVDLLGRSATEYGLYFLYLTIGFIVGTFVSTRISHRIGTDRSIAAGLLLFIAAWAVLAFFVLSNRWTALTLFGPGAALALTNGLIQPNCHAAAMNAAGNRKATAASLTGFAQVMAGAAGMQLAGWVQADGGSPRMMVAVIGGAAASALVLTLLLRNRWRQRELAVE
jgi:DHA1 family bicyclomycin/chloramphenicol resistance-like MFS transporter